MAGPGARIILTGSVGLLPPLRRLVLESPGFHHRCKLDMGGPQLLSEKAIDFQRMGGIDAVDAGQRIEGNTESP